MAMESTPNGSIQGAAEKHLPSLAQDGVAEATPATYDREEKAPSRDADGKYLDDLVAICEQGGTDFAASQQSRTERWRPLGCFA